MKTADERLTYRLLDGIAVREDLDFEIGADYEKVQVLLERLADYEDLGTVEELAELVEAKRDGRCVVLPCKVGDTLYEPYPNGMDEAMVDEIEIAICTNMGIYEPSDFGKTVFLTREAAEAALNRKAVECEKR